MIIECQTCHARFRLDESRIKGRGARVKCRKCGDSIVVLKDSAPPPPPPGGDGSFDLSSAVRDSAGESPRTPPPVGNLIPFPAPARPVEPEAREPFSRALNATEPEKDEVDLAFDRVLSAGVEAPSPSNGETEAEISSPAEADAPVRPDGSGGPPGAGPRCVDPGLRAGGKTGPSFPRGAGATARRAVRRRAAHGVPWRGGLPDQRFGIPGFPAEETSRRRVGDSPGGRRHLPGDHARAGRRGEPLSARTRSVPGAARGLGFSDLGGDPPRGERHPAAGSLSSKSRRTGRRNLSPRPPWNLRSAMDLRRRNPHAQGHPPGSPRR